MAWLITAALCVVGYLALELAGLVFGELVVALLSPFRPLYQPPHGAYVLGFTWIVALAGTVVGYRYIGSTVGVVGVMLCIPAALCASGVYRDEVHEARRYEYRPPQRLDV